MYKKSFIVITILVLGSFGIWYIKNKSVSPTEHQTTQPSPVQSDEITARIGKKSVSATGFEITPKELQEDSRCPANVNCIWAGRVVVKADVAFRGSVPQEYIFESDTKVRISSGDITLFGVTPVKTSGVIKSTDYMFTFSIQR